MVLSKRMSYSLVNRCTTKMIWKTQMRVMMFFLLYIIGQTRGKRQMLLSFSSQQTPDSIASFSRQYRNWKTRTTWSRRQQRLSVVADSIEPKHNYKLLPVWNMLEWHIKHLSIQLFLKSWMHQLAIIFPGRPCKRREWLLQGQLAKGDPLRTLLRTIQRATCEACWLTEARTKKSSRGPKPQMPKGLRKFRIWI